MGSHKPAAHNAVPPYLLVSDVARMLVFLRTTFDAFELYKQALPDGMVKHAEVRIDDSNDRTAAIRCTARRTCTFPMWMWLTNARWLPVRQ